MRNGKQDRFDSSQQQEFTAYYQSRLLQYRFDNYGRVAASSFDVPEFGFSLREVACSLGMCIEDTALRSTMLGRLRTQDKQARLEQSLDLKAVAIEAALFFCHDPAAKKQSFYMKEAAEVASGIMRERGEELEISPRRMGTLLNELGLYTEPVGNAGRAIVLTEGVRRRIHRLAREHAVLSILSGIQYCRHCGEDDEARLGPYAEHSEHGEHGER